jgi:transposase-like protein
LLGRYGKSFHQAEWVALMIFALKGNRAENSHLPIRRRERQQQGFKSRASAQRFLTTHAAVYNNFPTERHLNSRRYMRQLRE